ncbi:pentatricopeptide repeat-containing protein At3g50420 [Ricinus communis]|uniref:Pentatricopeptide repeat-containing protein, putative n=1 Tax=Ricinus communis TaxID=3988 RepID=B9S8N5_RICCO|nr:pentatricopeptide repeat-containing protein At3g50420 [Ricinus communis]EEF40038.1 pentatricopeptide repeat-containing protein, putative [Ricinus communis]|eukprot:XP_025013704.1 pentatricopeptide repeat-containing protein At3g50420 [Ricinus communis]
MSTICCLEALIKKCTTINSLKKARQLHALILATTASTSYAQSPYLNNNLIAMYAHCGSRSDAQKLFDRMPRKNAISYNALIAAYCRDSSYETLSFKLFSDMGIQRLRPNGATFTSLLQVCCLLEDWFLGSTLHGQVLQFGYVNDICVQTMLLGMYSDCGDLESACKVFGYAVEKDDVFWNSMISGYLKNDRIKESLSLFGEMVRSGTIFTQFTCSMALNACSKLGYYSQGRIIHAQVIVSNILPDSALQNALLDMYYSCGDRRTALTLFSRIQIPSLISWNSMISWFAKNEEGEKAMGLFVKLLGMSTCKPDEYTFTAIISATGEFRATDYGQPLHAQVIKAGLQWSVFIGNALLSMYFRNSDVEAARGVFSLMEEKDVVLWTEMIMGHCRLGDGESAIKLFCKMRQEGHKSDSFALSGALSVCADLAILKQGQMLHTQAVKTGCEAEISVCGSLVDMYAKNGNLQAAQLIFSQVCNPDLKCWNSMIGGYSHHGMAEEAVMLFAEVLECGLTPDQVTFLSLLSACNHSGLVEKGKFLWDYMKKNGITPGPKHYSCMVSLLSRAGLLDEAEELITESTCSEEHLKLWRTLLSSCVNRRNLTVGARAAKQVLRLDPEDSATYILLSNLYAVTGRWDGVAELRKKIRGLMLEKDPGVSWIEAKNDIHVFSSDDQSNPVIDEAQAEVRRLQRNMIRSVTDEYEFDARI